MQRSSEPQDFDASPTAEEVVARQGKGPISDPRVLLGDFWPEDEPIENFLAALHEWRGHSQADRAA